MTTLLATLFFVSSLGLAVLAAHRTEGASSIMDQPSTSAPAEDNAPASKAPGSKDDSPTMPSSDMPSSDDADGAPNATDDGNTSSRDSSGDMPPTGDRSDEKQ